MKLLFDTSVWVGARLGALVVTVNVADFALLASVLPLRAVSLADFEKRL